MFETFSKNPVPVFVSFFFAAISLGSAKKNITVNWPFGFQYRCILPEKPTFNIMLHNVEIFEIEKPTHDMEIPFLNKIRVSWEGQFLSHETA